MANPTPAKPVLASVTITALKPNADNNGNGIVAPCFVDDSYDPARFIIELPDRALRDLGKVDIASIDAGGVSWETSAIYNGTTALTPKRAFANVAQSQTDSSLVAAVSTKIIRVLAAVFIAGGTATNLTFNTKPAGAGSAISPLFASAANGGACIPPNPWGWFQTVVSEGLTVTTGAGSTTGILVTYVEV